MLRFYWDTILEIPRTFTRAALIFYALGTFVASVVGYFGIERGQQLMGFWEGLSPFWGVGVPVLAVFFWLLAVANFERFEALKTKVGEYESGGALRVVAQSANPGPVSIEEGAPDGIERREGEIVWVVPFRDDPVITIKVEDAGDEHRISVSYGVRGNANTDGFQMDTAVQVLNEDGEPIRRLFINIDWINVSEDGSWQYTVAASEDLLGLPEGAYGLNVLDFVDLPPALRGNTRREYSDMRLTVRKL